MGTLAAGSRMLQALIMERRGHRIASLDPKCGTPRKALLTISSISLLGTLLWGSRVGAVDYAVGCASIGSLALMLVYLAVCIAELLESCRARRLLWIAISSFAVPLMLWPLWNNLYPAPQFPDDLWPYVVLLWVLVGMTVARSIKQRQTQYM
jgi:hypothetical protein